MPRDQQHPHPQALRMRRVQQTMLRDQQQQAHQSDSPAPRAANNAARPAAPAPKHCASVARSKQCCGTSSTRTQALLKRRAQHTMLRDQQHPHPSAAQASRAAINAAGAAIRAPKRLSNAVRSKQCCGSTRTQALRKHRAQTTMLQLQQHPLSLSSAQIASKAAMLVASSY
jgi:hypothetical protein